MGSDTLLPMQLDEDLERGLDSESIRMIYASMKLDGCDVSIYQYISPFSCVPASLYLICNTTKLDIFAKYIERVASE